MTVQILPNTAVVQNLSRSEAGAKVSEVCQKHGISYATFYNWKSKDGGMEAADLKRNYGRLSAGGFVVTTKTDSMTPWAAYHLWSMPTECWKTPVFNYPLDGEAYATAIDDSALN